MNITPIQISRPLAKKNNSVTPSAIMKNKLLQPQQQQQNNFNGKVRERSQSLPENIFSRIKEKHYLPAAVFGFDESDISETESDNSDYDEDENENEDENGDKNENGVDLINLEQELVSL